MIPESILIVDDEPELRGLITDGLSHDGYLVEEADSFQTAMACLEHKHYPVILTDMNLPGGPSGLELIAAVKAKDPAALCVVITGFASLDIAIRAIKNGAYDFIQKPFKMAELEAVLDRALDHAMALRQLAAYQEDLEERVVLRIKEMKALNEEILCLNELLLTVQGETNLNVLTETFVTHLQQRFHPDGIVMLMPGKDGIWEILFKHGDRPWAAFGSLPPPEQFMEYREWGWKGGYPDGYLIPFRHGHRCFGAMFLGFEDRSVFQPNDPVFVLWRRHLEAAFNGLWCMREHAAAEVAKALSWH